MVHTALLRLRCALWPLLCVAIVCPAVGDDWLNSVADPKPARFRAARYQEAPREPAIAPAEPDTLRVPSPPPASSPPASSRLRTDLAAEPVPVPQADYERTNGQDVYFEDHVAEALEFDGLLGEFPWLRSGNGRIVAGAEFLNARPTFSEATAFARIDDFTTNSRQELVQYDFGYESTPRVYLGYQWPDCCVELRFTYTHLRGDAETASGEATGDTVFILNPNLPVCSCTEIVASASVDANTYDAEIGKCICLKSDPCCEDVCETSCRRPCNPWDVQYWVGVRVADVAWNTEAQVIDSDTDELTAQDNHEMTFSGAGPRVGLNLRRHFGRTGRLAMYGRANIALLLGHYEIRTSQMETDGVDTDTDSNLLSRDRIIPVTEIELGLSYTMRRRTTITAGYFFQAWHDLGMSQEVSGQFPPYDDANILSFDGMFLRGEWSF